MWYLSYSFHFCKDLISNEKGANCLINNVLCTQTSSCDSDFCQKFVLCLFACCFFCALSSFHDCIVLHFDLSLIYAWLLFRFRCCRCGTHDTIFAYVLPFTVIIWLHIINQILFNHDDIYFIKCYVHLARVHGRHFGQTGQKTVSHEIPLRNRYFFQNPIRFI